MADETAPIGLALTADGDIEILTAANGDGLRLTAGLEAVTDNVRSMIRLFKGEWFADTELGVTYWEDILGQQYDESRVLTAFRSAIFQVPHVLRIERLSSSFDSTSRTLTVYLEVITEFGNATITEVI